jgi:predicted nucleic acid-binding protein
VPDAICDTGPILHLQEIGKLETLTTFAPLILPTFVAAELEARDLGSVKLREAALEVTVSSVQELEWREILRDLAPHIQPADAQVFALVRASRYQRLALTDDLPLRRLLEGHGAQVVGTVGVLVRAYASARISRSELESSIEALFDQSSLFIGREFRFYLKNLLTDLR